MLREIFSNKAKVTPKCSDGAVSCLEQSEILRVYVEL